MFLTYAAKDSAVSLMPDAPNTSFDVAGDVSDFSIAFPASMGGKTVDLSPWASGRFSAIITWFRSATQWGLVATFVGWLSYSMYVLSKSMNQVQQAKGNAVLGGTGAQATALIAAGLITVAILAGLVGVVAFTVGDLSVTALINHFTANPVAEMPARAAWMLNEFFPIGTMLTLIAARVSFNILASKIYLAVGAVVRFIVP